MDEGGCILDPSVASIYDHSALIFLAILCLSVVKTANLYHASIRYIRLRLLYKHSQPKNTIQIAEDVALMKWGGGNLDTCTWTWGPPNASTDDWPRRLPSSVTTFRYPFATDEGHVRGLICSKIMQDSKPLNIPRQRKPKGNKSSLSLFIQYLGDPAGGWTHPQVFSTRGGATLHENKRDVLPSLLWTAPLSPRRLISHASRDGASCTFALRGLAPALESPL